MERFRYLGWSWDAGELRCSYALDDHEFVETFHVEAASAILDARSAAAARLVFLLAGISYYKAGAPPIIDLGSHAVTEREREFLRKYYVRGLGEFAYKNGVLSELEDLIIEGPLRVAEPILASTRRRDLSRLRPLVPFGGGIDSIVVLEEVRQLQPDLALFVASRKGARFQAIETAAAVTGLPVRRVDRTLDPKIMRSDELGFLNGHIPVTGVLSALAVLTATVNGRDAVVMSNEWSASSGTIDHDGIPVNHQWSKSLEFEKLFRAVLNDNLPGFEYFSALRPWSELWVARRFAALSSYHLAFRSCNRAFHLDPAQRLDRWCGTCDKCCFIDLILAPYLERERLEQIFDGNEPLANAALGTKFRALLGDPSLAKPFECVGDADECRVALVLAAARADRAGNPLLQGLATEVAAGVPLPPTETLLQPMGVSYLPADLLRQNEFDSEPETARAGIDRS